MVKQITILGLLLMAKWSLLDAQPITVKYPAGNIAYTKIDGIITFYNAQEKPVRIINLNKKTDLNLVTQEMGYLFTSCKSIAPADTNIHVCGEWFKHNSDSTVYTYNELGLRNNNYEDGTEEDKFINYKASKILGDNSCKYNAYGNLVETSHSSCYFTFGNVFMRIDDLDDVTKNVYDKQHYLIKQLHYQNNKQRATSYIEYDNQYRLKERFTYDRVLKSISNYQSFYYNTDSATIPSLIMKYEPHKQEGVLWVEQKERVDSIETILTYRVSIAAQPLAKMTVQDFRVLIAKTKEELNNNKRPYFAKRNITFKGKYQIVGYAEDYNNSKSSTTFDYDDSNKMIKQTNYTHDGKIVSDYLFRYNEILPLINRKKQQKK